MFPAGTAIQNRKSTELSCSRPETAIQNRKVKLICSWPGTAFQNRKTKLICSWPGMAVQKKKRNLRLLAGDSSLLFKPRL